MTVDASKGLAPAEITISIIQIQELRKWFRNFAFDSRYRLKPPSTAISVGQGAVVGVFMTTLSNAFSPSGLFPTPLLSQGFTSGNKPDHFHRSLCNDTSFPPVSL